MGNKAASNEIKSKGALLLAIVATGQISNPSEVGGTRPATFDDLLIKTPEGKVDIAETKRGICYALRLHLRGTGAANVGGRPKGPRAPSYDVANVTRATYHTFLANVTAGAELAVPLKELCIATAMAMSAKPAAFDKVQAAVRSAILDASGPFVATKGDKAFSPVVVRLKGAPTAPEPFTPWTDAPAVAPTLPAPAPAPEAPAAPPAAPAPSAPAPAAPAPSAPEANKPKKRK